jgi:hypothetical protein
MPTTTRPPYLLIHLIYTWSSRNSSLMPPGGTLAYWNRRTLTPVTLYYTHCWRFPLMKIRDAFINVVYARGHLPGRTVQLHISDTSTWITAPSRAKVLVGQRGGATLLFPSSLGVPDVFYSRKRFHSQENLTPHVKPKMMTCPHWLVLHTW